MSDNLDVLRLPANADLLALRGIIKPILGEYLGRQLYPKEEYVHTNEGHNVIFSDHPQYEDVLRSIQELRRSPLRGASDTTMEFENRCDDDALSILTIDLGRTSIVAVDKREIHQYYASELSEALGEFCKS